MNTLIHPTDEQTLPELFFERARRTPDRAAYRQFTGRDWEAVTWAGAAQQVGRWQAALTQAGLQPGDRVAICSRNRREWVFFDIAALGLGLVVVPLFYNDRPDNMAYCLTDAGARLIVLEDGSAWPALRTLTPDSLRAVCLTNAPANDARAAAVEAWLPASASPAVAGHARPDDLATLVYTSGTTGRPKGVMLTHRNIVFDLIGLIKQVPSITDHEPHHFLSFLPLSHMFERTAGEYIAIVIGATTTFARGILELAEDLVSQSPTVIVSVPRIFERVNSKLEAMMPPGSLKHRLLERTVAAGWRKFRREATLADHLLWPLLNILVARKLRARFGGKIVFIFLGGAALAPHLTRLFTGVGFTFIHGYGLTETSPVICANRVETNDPLSVGSPLPGVEIRLGEGNELFARGPIIMKGYWNNPDATAAVIDRDGWFRTGDVVELRDGRVYIRGRVKDIIVLSNGEKVPPGDAEQAILQDSVFDQVMVIGEGRAHLGLLCVSQLADEKELCRRANAQLRDFPGYARIRHLHRVSEAWTVENGMLTPTLKLKRNQIEVRCAAEIEAMYRRTDLCVD